MLQLLMNVERFFYLMLLQPTYPSCGHYIYIHVFVAPISDQETFVASIPLLTSINKPESQQHYFTVYILYTTVYNMVIDF